MSTAVAGVAEAEEGRPRRRLEVGTNATRECNTDGFSSWESVSLIRQWRLSRDMSSLLLELQSL